MSVYLDHAATTDLLPVARDALLEWLDVTANSTGAHRPARLARTAVEDARDDVAELLGCDRNEVVFCSGGTEADSLVVAGAAGPGPIVCSAVEHPAVLEAARARSAEIVAVDARGVVDLDHLDETLARLDGQVAAVSVMAANNEVGSIQPVVAVAEIVRRRAPGAVLHCDAVQAVPWIDLRPVTAVVDAMAVSAHKFGGPQGVGVAVLRGGNGSRIGARQLGGGQERELRSGTHNVAGIAATGAAARHLSSERATIAIEVGRRRDRLVRGILERVPGVIETGVVADDRGHKLPNNAHLCVEALDSEAVLFALDRAGISASAASSCASGAEQRSHVLAAMGVRPDQAAGALRLSLGWSTTDADVADAIDVISSTLLALRERSAGRLPTAQVVRS